MNAVVYARYSSHRQGEQSIEGQLAEAKRYAESHGLTIIHEYCDRAQSGRTDNREQFQLMLSDAAKGVFNHLIVWKTDRIGRNKEEIALNKYHLKKNGVKIHYIAEAIPDTPEGIILEAVIEGMAAYYSEQLSQNVRRGMRASAEKAQFTGGAYPLGYKVDENKKYVIDPQYAPTVRLIFNLYAEG
ncbi:MAG: recombinase family protein, partial [Lachnospiraceae bacterium]|nr:recombinase family protein [Lachnospiraceae bacterium]